MITPLCFTSALAAWVVLGSVRAFYGNATTYTAMPRDEFEHVSPPYYPRHPGQPAAELTPSYGRCGGYPMLHGRGVRGPRMFTQGYRGFSYRGGSF